MGTFAIVRRWNSVFTFWKLHLLCDSLENTCSHAFYTYYAFYAFFFHLLICK